MRWKLLLATVLTLVVMATGAAGCDSLAPPSTVKTPSVSGSVMFSQQNTGIWVTGEGKVSAVPDIAVLNLGVEAQYTTVADSQSQAATAMAAVVAELDNYGIDKKDIQTRQFSIYPIRRWSEEKGQEVLVGYRVTNMVTAKVRKIEDTAAIIDAVAVAGGDFIRINSVSFTVEDTSPYLAEAREKAMADAEAKARQLADLGDVKLGGLTYVSESGGLISTGREVFVEAAILAPMPAAPPTSISPGETEIRLSVLVAYSIE